LQDGGAAQIMATVSVAGGCSKVPIQARCDPTEVIRIESELAKAQSLMNVGVGVFDVTTGHIRLFTYDETDAFSRANLSLQVMAGHEAAAAMAGIPLDQARGFALLKDVNDWHLFNQSHLNHRDGQANAMQMAPATFQEVLAALQIAGVHNPVIA
jgi:hypothetical protein